MSNTQALVQRGKRFICLFLLFIAFSFMSNGQVLINKNWELDYALPDSVEWSASARNSLGEIVFTGNTYASGQDLNVLVIKFDRSGNIKWQYTYDHQNGKDAGTGIYVDTNDDIYVCAGVYDSTQASFDFMVMKMDNLGNVDWQEFYDGSGGEDVPTKIVVEDSSGDIYVTGKSWINGKMDDYATLKYDNGGGLQWAQTWDKANNIDVPADLQYRSGYVYVTGSAAATASDWSIVTLKYDASTGACVDTNDVGTIATGYDRPTAFDVDTAGNMYVIGNVPGTAPGTFDIKTLKINSSFTLTWSVTLDGYGLNDESEWIELDASGNIYICGYTTNSTGSRLLTVKYDNNGNELWRKEFTADPSAGYGVAKRVRLLGNNGILVAGTNKIGSSKDFMLIGYDQDGTQIIQKSWNGSNSGDDVVYDMRVYGDEVYVIGRSDFGVDQRYSTIRYSILEHNQPVILDTNQVPVRFQNELLVRFWPSAVNTTIIDNKDIVHGLLGDFLTSQAMQSLNNSLGTTADKYPCYKVFPRMTSADTISIGRDGDTVNIMHHYTTLGIILPTNSVDSVVLDSFMTAVSVVNFAQYNDIYTLTATANDPEYTNGNSAALVATTATPSANINIEPAWDVASGMPNVRIGVFDTGINFTHSDFGNGTFASSKIAGGFNYFNNIPLSQTTSNDLMGHGSACAGMIGGFRNNQFGVAGVAGGDIQNSNNGVTLYDMNIFRGNTTGCFPSAFFAGAGQVANAVVEGSTFTNSQGFGFGQHIQNHSWGSSTPLGLVFDAFVTAYDNHTVMSVSSGNDAPNQPNPCIFVNFPGSYKDRIVMKVGANDATGSRATFSNCGWGLDFIAPGVNALYTSLDKTGNGLVDFFTWGPNGQCTAPINGTSFAAPHVAGVAGLMASYVINNSQLPNPFHQEDYENLISYWATDLTAAPNAPGYDQETGFGRVNAGQVMNGIRYPDYQVIHKYFSVPVANAILVGFHEQTCLRNNMFTLPAGIQYVNRYQITGTNAHTIPTGYNFLTGWERGSACNVYGVNSSSTTPICNGSYPQMYLPDAHENTLNSVSATSAAMTGYIYEFLDGSFNTVGWYPFSINSGMGVKFAYTLYCVSSTLGIAENSFTEHSVSVYPNPSSDQVFITSNINEINELNVEIYSTLGQLIYREDKFKLSTSSSIDVSGLSNGVYFVHLKLNDKTHIKKIVVTH